MKWQTEMQLRGSSLLDDRRFDALADAPAELDEAAVVGVPVIWPLDGSMVRPAGSVPLSL